jgi:hypothetical protein
MLSLLFRPKTKLGTANNYEGFRNTPLISFALLSSVFSILGTEIKDAAKNYTERCYCPNERSHNRLKFPQIFGYQHLFKVIVRFA